jgi:hypothetical protein
MEKTPKTASEALELWDAGTTLQAFHVDTEGADQVEIWGAAFEILRKVQLAGKPDQIPRDLKLSDREHSVALSIAIVAAEKGWAAMMHQHDHPTIRRIEITKITK